MLNILKIFCMCFIFESLLRSQSNTRDIEDIDQLISFMKGSFNSESQSLQDSNYYNISLHMYPIWTQKEGHWLYVEQAVNSMQENPTVNVFTG